MNKVKNLTYIKKLFFGVGYTHGAMRKKPPESVVKTVSRHSFRLIFYGSVYTGANKLYWARSSRAKK